MTTGILRALAHSNLVDAAFDVGKQLDGGVFKTDFARSVSLFTTLPCLETAANLIASEPGFAQALVGYRQSPCRSVPVSARDLSCVGFDEFVNERLRNLATNAAVHRYLLTRCAAGSARIGFHSTRDQAVLYQRLAAIGLKKRWFADGRQFLRDAITANDGAFRVVSDVVCVHGVAAGREVWWDTLGHSRDGQWYLTSEMFYDLGPEAVSFTTLLSSVR